MKKLFILLFILLLFPIISYAGTIYANYNCSSLTGFTNTSTGTATTTAVTYDNKTCFKYDGGGTGVTNTAGTNIDIGSYPNIFLVVVDVYNNVLGDYTGVDSTDNRLTLLFTKNNVAFWVTFATNGLFIHDGTLANEVGTDIVNLNTWNRWSFIIDDTTPSTANVTIYKNGILIDSNVDCSLTGTFTEGTYNVTQYSGTVANTITYIDNVSISDPYYLSGTLEQITGSGPGIVNYLAIDRSTRNIFEKGITGSDGIFSIPTPDNVIQYDIIVLDFSTLDSNILTEKTVGKFP